MSTRIPVISVALAVLGASLVAGAIGTVPESATASASKCSRGCVAKVRFKSKGEKLIVHDLKADGHSAVALLQEWRDGAWRNKNGKYGKHGHFWNSKGFRAGPKVCNLSIPEGRAIRYRACIGERDNRYPVGGRVFMGTCSRHWQYDTA